MNSDTALRLNAEMMAQAELLLALVQTHPELKRVHLAFLSRMESLLAETPPDIDGELVIEIRARMAQTSLILQKLTLPTESD